jgi:hypothetical protein
MRRAKFELDGLPVLGIGRHPDPTAGGCFMEYASLLAGERWTDHPRCTHPALAQLARLVNDAIPADARQTLVPLIPDVVGVVGRDMRVTPELVLLCLDHAGGFDRRAATVRAARAASRRLLAASLGDDAARWCRLTDTPYRLGPAAVAMRRTVCLLALDRTGGTRLHDLLRDAITLTTRRLTTRPAGSEATQAIDAGVPDPLMRRRSERRDPAAGGSRSPVRPE